MKWNVIPITNSQSNYDFRLCGNNIDFSQSHFFLKLTIIASCFTHGYFMKKFKWYQVSDIFNHRIEIKSKSKKFCVLHKNKICMFTPKPQTINFLQYSKMYDNLLEINRVKQETIDNHINLGLFFTTGWMNRSSIIIDLISRHDKLGRFSISKKHLLFNKKCGKFCGYQVMICRVNKNKIEIIRTKKISFDYYLAYIYDLTLPCLYDGRASDILSTKRIIRTNNNNITTGSTHGIAIDPMGSRDRDDALWVDYLDKNLKLQNVIEKASYIRLYVHISDVLSVMKGTYHEKHCKYQNNTAYLDKNTLPLMDRCLSENLFSLEGIRDCNTVEITYSIVSHNKINPIAYSVRCYKSTGVKIKGMTYLDFAMKFYTTKTKKLYFNKRYILSRYPTLRNFHQIFHKGIAKNPAYERLKTLYCFFVNSLTHTGKDTLVRVPRQIVQKGSDFFLDYLVQDAWVHSLVEYCALEANIYTGYLLCWKNKHEKLYITQSQILNLRSILMDSFVDRINGEDTRPFTGVFRNLHSSENLPINSRILNSLKVPGNSRITSTDIRKWIKYVGNENSDLMTTILGFREMNLKVAKKKGGNYAVVATLTNPQDVMKGTYATHPTGHIDIASPIYTHATSPMRRFADIMVHKLLFEPNFKTPVDSSMEHINIMTKKSKHLNQLVQEHRLQQWIAKTKHNTHTVVIEFHRSLLGLLEYNQTIYYNYKNSSEIDWKPYDGKTIEVKLRLNQNNQIEIIKIVNPIVKNMSKVVRRMIQNMMKREKSITKLNKVEKEKIIKIMNQTLL